MDRILFLVGVAIRKTQLNDRSERESLRERRCSNFHTVSNLSISEQELARFVLKNVITFFGRLCQTRFQKQLQRYSLTKRLTALWFDQRVALHI